MTNDPIFEDSFRVLIENTLHGADPATRANRIINLRHITRTMLDDYLDSTLLGILRTMTSREAAEDIDMSRQMMADRVTAYCDRTGLPRPWSAGQDRRKTLDAARSWRTLAQGSESSANGGHV